MFSLFKKKSAISIEMSPHSIEMFQLNLSPHRGLFNIQAYSRKVLPVGIIDLNGRIKRKDDLAKILESMYNVPTWGKYEGKEVVFSLPISVVYSKIFHYDQTFPTELKEQRKIIYRDIQSNIPLELQDSLWDWQIYKAKDRFDIYVAVMYKKILDNYVTVFKRAGFIPVVGEPESLSMIRGLGYEDKKIKTKLLVHIGSYTTKIIVFSQAGILLDTILNIGSMTLTEKIAENLHVSLKKAEKIKRKYSFSPDALDGHVLLISQAIFQPVIEELQSIDKYVNKYYNIKIEKIIITGGGALAPGLIEYIGSNLNMKSFLGKIKINTIPKLDNTLHVILPVVIGGALRGVQKDYSKKQRINFLKYLYKK